MKTPPAPARLWALRCFRRLLQALGGLCQFLAIAWASLALYYSPLPSPALRTSLALAFAAFAIWALWIRADRRAFLAFAAAFLALLLAWAQLQPSQHRPWRPEVATLPQAHIDGDGDRIQLRHVRHFDYHTATDFTPHYEDREVRLSHLQSLDFLVSYWMPGPVAHTFVSFNFDNAPPVCISIETRPTVGQTYSPLASLFKQYELIYVVADERDLIRLRTQFRRESVYLYRTNSPPEAARRLFLSYLEKINRLAEHPEFYHLLSNNCTVNIIRHIREDGRPRPFDIRMLLNGYIDAYAYLIGALNTSLPFPELRARSLINPAAQASDQDPSFSARIRQALPLPNPLTP